MKHLSLKLLLVSLVSHSLHSWGAPPKLVSWSASGSAGCDASSVQLIENGGSFSFLFGSFGPELTCRRTAPIGSAALLAYARSRDGIERVRLPSGPFSERWRSKNPGSERALSLYKLLEPQRPRLSNNKVGKTKRDLCARSGVAFLICYFSTHEMLSR
jgi:hypothetical protein